LKKKIFEKGMELLDLPKEVSLDIAYITMTGNLGITIENYRGIISYDDKALKINTKDSILKVEGEEMVLSLITEEILSVSGIIKKVEFI
jgi:sporulation protein YqfC